MKLGLKIERLNLLHIDLKTKQPKPTSNPVDDELNVHSLADE